MKNTERSSGTKNLILDTAARLFMEKGYEQTSVNDILKFSGIATALCFYSSVRQSSSIDKIFSSFILNNLPFLLIIEYIVKLYCIFKASSIVEIGVFFIKKGKPTN